MRLETILNASNIAYARYCYIPEFDESKFGRRMRQYRAFRARILRMYDQALDDGEVAYFVGINVAWEVHQEDIKLKDARMHRILAQLDAHKLSQEFALEEKDAEIAQLRIRVEALSDPNYFSKLFRGRK